MIQHIQKAMFFKQLKRHPLMKHRAMLHFSLQLQVTQFPERQPVGAHEIHTYGLGHNSYVPFSFQK